MKTETAREKMQKQRELVTNIPVEERLKKNQQIFNELADMNYKTSELLTELEIIRKGWTHE